MLLLLRAQYCRGAPHCCMHLTFFHQRLTCGCPPVCSTRSRRLPGCPLTPSSCCELCAPLLLFSPPTLTVDGSAAAVRCALNALLAHRSPAAHRFKCACSRQRHKVTTFFRPMCHLSSFSDTVAHISGSAAESGQTAIRCCWRASRTARWCRSWRRSHTRYSRNKTELDQDMFWSPD